MGPGRAGGQFEDVFSTMFGGAGGAGWSGRSPGPVQHRRRRPAGPRWRTCWAACSAAAAAYGGYGAPRGPQRGADVEAATRLGFRQAAHGETVQLRSQDGQTITVRIPAGVKDGQRIRLPGKGRPGDQGAPAGDMVVTVQVEPHPVFGRDGDNLTVTVPVTFAEAALGATLEVPTLDGSTVKVKLPRARRAAGSCGSRAGASSARATPGATCWPRSKSLCRKRLSDEAREAVEAFQRGHRGRGPAGRAARPGQGELRWPRTGRPGRRSTRTPPSS